MADLRSFTVPETIAVLGVRLKPHTDPSKKALPLQVCPHKTSIPKGAIQQEYGCLLAVCFADGWLCVQLPRDHTCLMGLPLTGYHPAGTWADLFDNDRVEMCSLRETSEGGWCWEAIEDWDEIISMTI